MGKLERIAGFVIHILMFFFYLVIFDVSPLSMVGLQQDGALTSLLSHFMSLFQVVIFSASHFFMDPMDCAIFSPLVTVPLLLSQASQATPPLIS